MAKQKQTKPAQAKPKPNAERPDMRTLLRYAAILALCAGIVFGTVLAAFSVRGERLQRKYPYIFGGQAQRECIYDIDFDEETLHEYLRSTKRHGQKSAFTYFCAGRLYMPSKSEYGAIHFGNPATNDCVLVLTIVDETDHVVYRSDGVAPGKYITFIHPRMDGTEGSFPCRAYVSGYTYAEDGYVCIGVQYSSLIVDIGGTGL